MINTRLNNLFQGWKKEMEDNGDLGFCQDGLIYRNGEEDRLWKNSKRRILFLLQENNDNDGQDVREWTGSINGYSPNGLFFNRLSAWLYGLMNYTDNSYPSIEDAFNPENQMKALSEYPYAYVNVKKKSGGATADDSVVYDFAKRYASYLRQELDILSPNIIVCGGQVVFNVATDIIYPELTFYQKNSWVYYNKENNLILINSFHPTARKSNEEIYGWMMENVAKRG